MVDRLTLSVKEAGLALGISPYTVRLYIRQGKITPIRLGRRILIEPSELRRLLEQSKVKLASSTP